LLYVLASSACIIYVPLSGLNMWCAWFAGGKRARVFILHQNQAGVKTVRAKYGEARAHWQDEEKRVLYETDSFNLLYYASAEGGVQKRLAHRIARMLVESEVRAPSCSKASLIKSLNLDNVSLLSRANKMRQISTRNKTLTFDTEHCSHASRIESRPSRL
jgi:hypothetical protein